MASIEINNLRIDFSIFGARGRSIKNMILSQAIGGRFVEGKNNIVTVRALDGLCLNVRDGERIGLVGHNGSGKTTLLRALAGIYKPSSGYIDIEGETMALFDFGSGMDHECSGRENIYLRGYMMGKSKTEILSKFDDIVDFTELGQFIDLPLRTYSAGMNARLSFAISTAWPSDILLLDEGIGAGDTSFQKKAEARIERLFERTSIMFLASHSEDLIKSYCSRQIVMDHGRIVDDCIL